MRRIPHRKSANKRSDKRGFTKHARKVHVKNVPRVAMRGGIRL